MPDASVYETNALVQGFSRQIEAGRISPPDSQNDEELRSVFIDDIRRTWAAKEAEIADIMSTTSINRLVLLNFFHVARMKRFQSRSRFDDFLLTLLILSDQAVLMKARQGLSQAMQEFRLAVPEACDRIGRSCTISDVQRIIAQVQEQWDKKDTTNKFGRAKALFHKICNGIHNHSAALKLIPSENNYVSVLSGAINMIVMVFKFL
jgi:hypothetical protein